MTAYTDALEAFNRASHSDALREMQLAPAETEQPVQIVGSGARWSVPIMLALCFAITVIGAVKL